MWSPAILVPKTFGLKKMLIEKSLSENSFTKRSTNLVKNVGYILCPRQGYNPGPRSLDPFYIESYNIN